jgi:Mrp family chromosome partitioning ATPase
MTDKWGDAAEKVVDFNTAKATGNDRGNGKLTLRLASLRKADEIPPRQWLYGTQLIRGHVTVLVAPGGTGKSAYAMGVGISIAAHRSYLGEYIFGGCNVAIINLDDPMDELDRRVAAFMLAHSISAAQLDGRLFLEDCDGHGLTLAALERGDNGLQVVNPDEDSLVSLLRENRVGLVVCDPFAESHTLEENSNPQMIQAAAVWRRVARTANCAVLLVHHVRKGDVTSIDAARGAKALTDSARVGLLMTTMSAEEASEFGIEDDDRLSYVRLDDAKRNMAAATKAQWFHLRPIRLGNTFDPTYPRGDSVGAIVPWQPPDNELATAPNNELNTVLDAIKAGPEEGVLYTKSRRGDSNRWCGQLLCEAFQVQEKQAAKMVSAWFHSGLLFETTYYHPKWRRHTKGVCVSDTQRPT